MWPIELCHCQWPWSTLKASDRDWNVKVLKFFACVIPISIVKLREYFKMVLVTRLRYTFYHTRIFYVVNFAYERVRWVGRARAVDTAAKRDDWRAPASVSPCSSACLSLYGCVCVTRVRCTYRHFQHKLRWQTTHMSCKVQEAQLVLG